MDAQLDVVNYELPQASADPKFPYCTCLRQPPNPSPYSFLPTVEVRGRGQFCFTLIVNTTGCRGTCCAVDLKKIEVRIEIGCSELLCYDYPATYPASACSCKSTCSYYIYIYIVHLRIHCMCQVSRKQRRFCFSRDFISIFM